MRNGILLLQTVTTTTCWLTHAHILIHTLRQTHVHIVKWACIVQFAKLTAASLFFLPIPFFFSHAVTHNVTYLSTRVHMCVCLWASVCCICRGVVCVNSLLFLNCAHDDHDHPVQTHLPKFLLFLLCTLSSFSCSIRLIHSLALSLGPHNLLKIDLPARTALRKYHPNATVNSNGFESLPLPPRDDLPHPTKSVDAWMNLMRTFTVYTWYVVYMYSIVVIQQHVNPTNLVAIWISIFQSDCTWKVCFKLYHRLIQSRIFFI